MNKSIFILILIGFCGFGKTHSLQAREKRDTVYILVDCKDKFIKYSYGKDSTEITSYSFYYKDMIKRYQKSKAKEDSIAKVIGEERILAQKIPEPCLTFDLFGKSKYVNKKQLCKLNLHDRLYIRKINLFKVSLFFIEKINDNKFKIRKGRLREIE